MRSRSVAQQIAIQLPRTQRPNYFTFGAKNTKFYGQKPFLV
jgi:hypothetical protein